MISWIWPFALFVGGSGVGAEDQEPPDQGEEAAGQGRGVPRRAGGHPTGWVIPQPPTIGHKGPPTTIYLSDPHHIKTGLNGPQLASKGQKRLQWAWWASVVLNRTYWTWNGHSWSKLSILLGYAIHFQDICQVSCQMIIHVCYNFRLGN